MSRGLKRFAMISLALFWVSLCGVFGKGFADYRVHNGTQANSFIHVENWFTSRHVGSKNADAKTRAFVAVSGLLGLAKEETLYFRLNKDDQGRALTSDFEYEIVGANLPARWWSLTLYDQDHFLTRNTTGPYSVKGSVVVADQNGQFTIRLAANGKSVQPGEYWIDMGEGQNMSLSLRMYNPDLAALRNLTELRLPTVRRVN